MGPLDGSLSLDLHYVTARVFLEVLKGFLQLDLGSLFHLFIYYLWQVLSIFFRLDAKCLCASI